VLVLPAPALRRRWRQLALRTWARAALRVLSVRITVCGLPPARPFLLVANHLGYLDVLVLASVAPAVFVAKSEVRSWPVLGLLARAMGTVFIDRGRPRDAVRVLRRLERLRESGEGIVVFAEGTTSPGDGVLPLRPALLASAARQGWPVHHAALGYRAPLDAPSARTAVCWWGDMPFAPHVRRLCEMRGAAARITFGPVAVADPDRKRLAYRLHRALVRDFTPVV
jgi:1-acyl-sn-glycerol-3-phosphate acyltransferase